ncbi:hypothetical protein EG68_03931 [Paragonimus skrjabini miyazakii]|uniref:Uncharacterized protein n=1 Tax=Paragonimus skrjabini miyazakii TaxID=59628 RepID=A0A8S9Z3T4_9TREM|nr:hypothetical protein EG68_03931 [Paragonimus skrjabini miyazakii]
MTYNQRSNNSILIPETLEVIVYSLAEFVRVTNSVLHHKWRRYTTRTICQHHLLHVIAGPPPIVHLSSTLTD